MTYILTSNDPLEAFRTEAGGKAANLRKLVNTGISIPTWFCLTANAFDAFLDMHRLKDALLVSEDFESTSRYIESIFMSCELPDSVEESLNEALRQHELLDAFVAVRSSGIDEDSADHSFAGQFSSFLHQRGINAIRDSIKRCWASGFSERALAYRKQHGLSLQNIRVGVIIQRMVDAAVAGVAFSRNPLAPLNRDCVMVDAVLGLGEGLVSGLLDADHYTMSRKDRTVKQTVVQKKEAIYPSPSGATHLVAVPKPDQEKAALSNEQVHAVADCAISFENFFGGPQDIEWAIDSGGVLHILQTRPITTLPPAAFFDPMINGKEATLWDNSNIVESYSGVTSPFTFSFASHAYRQVYVQFCEVMGVPQQVIVEHEAMFRNMLGSIRGHVYYNLINWYRLVQLLPGMGSNAAFMETMMGVKQSLHPDVASLFDFMNHPPTYSISKRVRVLGLTIWRFLRMPSIMKSFWSQFDRVYNESRAMDFTAMSLPALSNHYQYLNEEVLKKWHAPIINDYLCMLFFGLLKKLTENWITDSASSASLQNDLLCGEGDLESTEPTKMLMRIAAFIDLGDPDLKDWFVDTPADEVWEALSQRKVAPALFYRMQEFLDAYGFRCVNELKLEEPDLHDDPSFIIDTLAGYVRTKSYNIEAMEQRERQIRTQAESIVNSRLSGIRKRLFYWVLKQTREAVKRRENLRFARTKIFGIARHLFRSAGAQLAKLGVLSSKHDIFYLTVDEVIGYIDGRTVTTRLSDLVQMRMKEYNEYRAAPPPPDRFLTYGAVGASISLPQVLADADLLPPERNESSDRNTLSGTPCCPGVIEGIVRVVQHPGDARGLDNEILVTARTDPGWVPLFPSCSGLLIERGSLLSHSAVVARELGLPTIVGISGGLMQRLHTGQRVRMDAGKGEVVIL